MDRIAHEQDYLFDLRGYLILDQALGPAELAEINGWIDVQPPDAALGSWQGDVELHTYSGNEGVNYQNIIEAGGIFERMIDHDSWLPLAERWMVNDYSRISLNEAFLNVRRSGGFIGLHSGGHVSAPIMTVRNANTGAWNVGQINVLIALADIGPGDGCTVVVPGSHKSAVLHPELVDSPGNSVYRSDRHAGGSLGAIEVHLKAGQAVMFTDAISHGATARTNPGCRRVAIYRYSPHAIASRYNYLPSPELLARLTPRQRAIVQPVAPRCAPQRRGAA
jgi:hypothetical protein